MLTLDQSFKEQKVTLVSFLVGLLQKGYAASRSHIATNAIKTNCPMTECISIAKELLQLPTSYSSAHNAITANSDA